MNTTWITGAAGTVGSALAETLAAKGHQLVLTGRDVDRLHALAERLGGNCHIAAGDVSEPGVAAELRASSEAAIGPITGFAHCVGSTLIKPLHLTREADFEAVMKHNFFSAAYCLKAFVDGARKHREPSAAVLVGSLVAHAGFPNHEAIGSAKAAVAGLALSTAASYADKGIRVNCVHPGLVVSPLAGRLTDSDEAIMRNSKPNPMQRIGRGPDIAGLMAFLLSEEASWITGQSINIDGGQGLIHPLPRG
jgi:NAD(P)-dependent dehydrogenase (short-subunit alcohol dehydrogenase family)